MSIFGTCDTGCSEEKFELIRAVAHDSLTALRPRVRDNLEAFRPVVERLAREQPAAGGWETAYRSLQDEARTALRRHPDIPVGEFDWEPAEVAITWRCPRCGGIDAPQECLGICVWRPVEWVTRDTYEEEREQTLAERDQEGKLRRLLRVIASVTPRREAWERSWNALRAQASQALVPADSDR
jgi:hypothetical protein